MRMKLILSLAMLSVATVTGTAQALTATSLLTVGATVINSCAVAASTLTFINYDPVATSPTDAASSIAVTCTTGTSYNVGLSAGNGTGATVAVRKMTHATVPSNVLEYSLYSDSQHNSVWGNTVGTNTLAATATAVPNVIPVYGRLSAAQNVATGAYTDTVTVTVTY